MSLVLEPLIDSRGKKMDNDNDSTNANGDIVCVFFLWVVSIEAIIPLAYTPHITFPLFS